MHQMREGIGAFIAAMGINERWVNVSLAPPELLLCNAAQCAVHTAPREGGFIFT
jgi:hypothetical protein